MIENNCNENDCMETTGFPKKIHNRPGLSHIDYRIGTYSNFRQAVLEKLNNNHSLAAWTHKSPDDTAFALLESASIICDILTFYQEVYANETKLRTVQWRESISDLVRLVGYRLSPGLGGRATFALEASGVKPILIKDGYPIKAEIEGYEDQQPVSFESNGDVIAYPWLSKFNLYRPLEASVITKNSVEFYVSLTDQHNSSEIEIIPKEGDLLIIGDPAPQANTSVISPSDIINSEIVIVDKVRELHGRKLFTIKGTLQKREESSNQVIAYKIGRSFHHFGYNASRKIVNIASNGTSAQENIISYIRFTTKDTAAGTLYIVNDCDQKVVIDPSPLRTLDYPLDNEIRDLSAGISILIMVRQLLLIDPVSPNYRERGFKIISNSSEYTFLRTIKAIRSSSITWGAVSGATTFISLKENEELKFKYSSTKDYNALDIRDIQFFEVISPRLVLRAAPVETSKTKGKELYYYGTSEQASTLEGRRILLAPLNRDPFVANVVSINSTAAFDSHHLHTVTLDRDVESYADFPHTNPIITVYGNLVDATQGKTENDVILGNGDRRQKFQTFKIPKSPLTYLNAVDEDPPQIPELEIYVNDRLWRRVPSLFDRGPKEEVFIVREDTNGDSWVQFGDGETGGARIPSGIRNVVAKYRTGIGAHGPLKTGTTVQVASRIQNLDKIQLLGVVSGGAKSESVDKARMTTPGKTQSLGRLVSLKDFESEASSVPGVTKVSARLGLEDNFVPAIILTVLMESGREKEFDQIWQILNSYNKARGMQRFRISVHQAKVRYVYLSIDFGFQANHQKEEIEKTIKESLGVGQNRTTCSLNGLFGIYQRNFGDKEYSSRIEGTVQNVDGVIWVKVKALGVLDETYDPSTLSVPKQKQFSEVISCDNNSLLVLYIKHLELNGIPVQPIGGKRHIE